MYAACDQENPTLPRQPMAGCVQSIFLLTKKKSHIIDKINHQSFLIHLRLQKDDDDLLCEIAGVCR